MFLEALVLSVIGISNTLGRILTGWLADRPGISSDPPENPDPYLYLKTFPMFSEDQAALVLSVIGISNTLGRILTGWLADRPGVSSLREETLHYTSIKITKKNYTLGPNKNYSFNYFCKSKIPVY